MPTLLDLLYVALFAVAAPVFDYLVFWPKLRRRFETDPANARKQLYMQAVTLPWVVVATGAAIWHFKDRPWTSLGFSWPEGWRLWAAIVLVLLHASYLILAILSLGRDSKAMESAQSQIGAIADYVPHTKPELYWFAGVSLTAGFCEEFLFRGYFIWALAPWLGWWGAAVLSVAIFAAGHAYQGSNGAIRTGVVGTLFTLVVAMSGSLWPAIVLHAVLDLGQGVIAWLVLREGSVVAAEPQT